MLRFEYWKHLWAFTFDFACAWISPMPIRKLLTQFDKYVIKIVPFFSSISLVQLCQRCHSFQHILSLFSQFYPILHLKKTYLKIFIDSIQPVYLDDANANIMRCSTLMKNYFFQVSLKLPLEVLQSYQLFVFILSYFYFISE